jgi:hypothetical protein
LVRTLALSVLVVVLAGCDHGDAFDDCTSSPDTPGARVDACPWSQFPDEDFRARELTGRVRNGDALVPNALVRIDNASYRPTASLLPITVLTDSVGFFSGIRTVPLIYDISARFDSNVIVYRNAAARYFEPAIEASTRSFGRAFTSRVQVTLEHPLDPTHSVAFFASGDNVLSVSGDVAHGLSILTSTYTATATLHAVEYVTAGGLETAMAYATDDVDVEPGVEDVAKLTFAPITVFAAPRFTASAPPGFVASTVDVVIGFTQTSDGRLISVPMGEAKQFPVIPKANYTYHSIATRSDGALSDSGEVTFNVHQPETQIEFAEAPTAEAPAASATIGAGDLLVASGEGVLEHVLVSKSGGPTVRVVTTQAETKLPDVVSLGAPPAVGDYEWTVRSYPTARYVEELSGPNARRYRPMGASPPRPLVLR